MDRNGGARERPVDGLDHVRPGDHVCWFYRDDDAFQDQLIRYIGAGLRSGERVACYVSADHLSRLFASAGSWLLDVLERGSLLLGTAEEAYLPDGSFDQDRRIEDYQGLAAQAHADGFAGLRVLGDATAIVLDPVARVHWPAYEVRADLLSARTPLIAACAYDLRRCDVEALEVLRGLHPGFYGAAAAEPVFRLHADELGALRLGGEIDLANAHVIAEIARRAASEMADPTLDLSEVRFIDASGMRAVIDAARAIVTAHERVRLRGAGPSFTRMWDLLACERYVNVEFEPA